MLQDPLMKKDERFVNFTLRFAKVLGELRNLGERFA